MATQLDKENLGGRQSRMVEPFQDGVFLIHKQKDRTSFQEVARLRKLAQRKKVGHAGTLDRFATGLMVIATGRYTRLLDYLMHMDKVYDFVVDYTWLNETLDPEGQDWRFFGKVITDKQARSQANRMTGEWDQWPPDYSALKVNGRRLSDWHRNGQKPPKSKGPRRIRIHNLRLLAEEGANRFRYLARVSSGTYIRALGRDLGSAEEVGGVIRRLVRRRVGPWHLRQAVTLPDKAAEVGLLHRGRLPDWQLARLGRPVVLSPKEVRLLKQGSKKVLWPHVQNGVGGGLYLCYDSDGSLVGILECGSLLPGAPEGKIKVNFAHRAKNDCQNEQYFWNMTKLKVFCD